MNKLFKNLAGYVGAKDELGLHQQSRIELFLKKKRCRRVAHRRIIHHLHHKAFYI